MKRHKKFKFSKFLTTMISLTIVSSMIISSATAASTLSEQQMINGNGVTFPYTNIPTEYKGLYTFLNTSLDKMSTNENNSSYTTMVASNLLVANSNALPDIADNPRNLTTVSKTLDMFVDIGLKVVDITIQYPSLVNGFPRSQDYLEYYKKVFQEAEKRHLKIAVEVASTFTSPMFAKLPVKGWYAGLTKDRYCREKRQMIETVINELSPDYLAIEEEPTTQQSNLGLSYTVADEKYYLDYFLKDLDTKGIPIGAGAGLWDEDGYWDLYLNNPSIDFISFHIYPINDPKLISKLDSLSKRAVEKGKKVVVGEAWLYKTNGQEKTRGPIATAEEVFARDAYSFWQPLDCKFIDALMNLASKYKWEYVNFFWSKCFFSYVDYNNNTKNAMNAYALQQQSATMNIYNKELSMTGKYLKYKLSKK